MKRPSFFNGRQGGDTTGQEERVMMEDVHDAIFDLVELIKTYKSKNRLSQLLMSTLFRRRQDEMGAVVDRAILSLQVSAVYAPTRVGDKTGSECRYYWSSRLRNSSA